MTRKTLVRNLVHPIRALDGWWTEVSPQRRMDRGAANICMLIGLIFPTLAIVLVGPVPSSVLERMPEWLQVWMCGCIFFGCSIKLHGVCTGSRFWFPHTSVKKSYSYGFIGAPLASAGLFVYGWFILAYTPNFVAALSGVLTPMLGLGIGLQAFFYWLEWRRIDRVEDQMIVTAKEELQSDSDVMD